MSTPIVDLQGIVTRFGDLLVHDGLELKVERGDIVSLIGGSGSGKTTLLRHLIGLTAPVSGTVMMFGEPLLSGAQHEQRARRRRFGVLFQQGALFSALNVSQNIAFPLRELRVASQAEIDALVLRKLAMVELEPAHALLMPSELSGGMIKRVALARALALEPELLLLDEPTAGLDPDLSLSFVELIRSLHRRLHLTIVLVTHDIDTLMALSTKVAVLADRKIVSCAPVEETIALDHPFVSRFFKAVIDRRRIAPVAGVQD
ncbi:MAG: ATP-binding cassette domain-containing protein [Rhodocyclaceae bacterium]|jgi:phospholipid/cholesterol/gamma-HCH transport system ATP-binding protein|nr:ATP-binding cassette domain-containing protein [Rhodocyclaceae bacterium]MCL4757396.1 ATP-binding cassette domain-containing protein [Rhodocyclaceae bacterium]